MYVCILLVYIMITLSTVYDVIQLLTLKDFPEVWKGGQPPPGGGGLGLSHLLQPQGGGMRYGQTGTGRVGMGGVGVGQGMAGFGGVGSMHHNQVGPHTQHQPPQQHVWSGGQGGTIQHPHQTFGASHAPMGSSFGGAAPFQQQQQGSLAYGNRQQQQQQTSMFLNTPTPGAPPPRMG